MGKVSGIVRYQGKPLSKASVNFISNLPGASRFGTGVTDEQGKFQLTTFTKNDGAIVGDYVVTVTKQDSAEQPTTTMPTTMPITKTIKPPVSLVPEKYTNPKTTPLQQSVSLGLNEVEIELID